MKNEKLNINHKEHKVLTQRTQRTQRKLLHIILSPLTLSL
jgi:hypothetical protein